jgi:hypothetical protein
MAFLAAGENHVSSKEQPIKGQKFRCLSDWPHVNGWLLEAAMPTTEIGD